MLMSPMNAPMNAPVLTGAKPKQWLINCHLHTCPQLHVDVQSIGLFVWTVTINSLQRCADSWSNLNAETWTYGPKTDVCELYQATVCRDELTSETWFTNECCNVDYNEIETVTYVLTDWHAFIAWSGRTVQRLTCVDCDKQQPAEMSWQFHQAMCYKRHVQPSEGLLQTTPRKCLQRWAHSLSTLNADLPKKWLSVEYSKIEAVTDLITRAESWELDVCSQPQHDIYAKTRLTCCDSYRRQWVQMNLAHSLGNHIIVYVTYRYESISMLNHSKDALCSVVETETVSDISLT